MIHPVRRRKRVAALSIGVLISIAGATAFSGPSAQAVDLDWEACNAAPSEGLSARDQQAVYESLCPIVEEVAGLQPVLPLPPSPAPAAAPAPRPAKKASQPVAAPRPAARTAAQPAKKAEAVAGLLRVKNDGGPRTAVQVLSSESGFTWPTFVADTPEGAQTAGNVQYVMGDYNRDGVKDLVKVGHFGATGSGRAEVHILSGATHFQTYLLNTGTPDPIQPSSDVTYGMADYDHDGSPDLYRVQHGKSGSGRTELHVLSGASKYQKYLLHDATAAGLHTDSNSEYHVADYDGDAKPDLLSVAYAGTGSGKTEVHVLSARSGFEHYIAHVVTAEGLQRADHVQYDVGDVNGDGSLDVAKVSIGGTQTGNTELHVLSGKSNFQSHLRNLDTRQAAQTDQSVRFFLNNQKF